MISPITPIIIGAIIAMFISAAIWKKDKEKNYKFMDCYYEDVLEALIGTFIVFPLLGGIFTFVACLIICLLNWWLIPLILVILTIIFIVYYKEVKEFIKEREVK